MSRLFLMVLVAAALVVPTAASAMPPEHVKSAPINARGTDVAADFRARGGSDVAPEPVAGDGGMSLGTAGIGIGLVLVAGGLGVYAGRSMRPRHIGV